MKGNIMINNLDKRYKVYGDFGDCAFQQSIKTLTQLKRRIDLNLEYKDYAFQQESFLKKLNKKEKEELESLLIIVDTLKGHMERHSKRNEK